MKHSLVAAVAAASFLAVAACNGTEHEADTAEPVQDHTVAPAAAGAPATAPAMQHDSAAGDTTHTTTGM